MRHGIDGNAKAEDLGQGHWRLYLPGSSVEIHLRAEGFSAADLRGSSGVSVQWLDEGVFLWVASPHGERRIPLRSAQVHEPRPRLYDGLPLGQVDDKTRRFWRRVFRVVRLPGGHLLLGFLARRAR